MKNGRLDELEFCEQCNCPYHGEPNGCNRTEGECEPYKQYFELKELEESLKGKEVIALPHMEMHYINHGWTQAKPVWSVVFREPVYGVVVESFGNENEARAFLEKQEKLAIQVIDYEKLQKATETFNTLAARHRRGEHLTDAEVDEMLAAWDRKVDLEKKGGLYHVSK